MPERHAGFRSGHPSISNGVADSPPPPHHHTLSPPPPLHARPLSLAFHAIRGWLVQHQGGEEVHNTTHGTLTALAATTHQADDPTAAARPTTIPDDLRTPFATIQGWLLQRRDGQQSYTDMQNALLDFIDLKADNGGTSSATPQSTRAQEGPARPRKKPKIAANAAAKAAHPAHPTAPPLSRQDSVVRALLRTADQKGCRRQIWEAMNGAERKAFAGQTALNKYCHEQSRRYSKTAWLDSSVHDCTCSVHDYTSAGHGAVYNARGDAPSWARIDAGEQARLRDAFKALEAFVDGEVNLRGDILTVGFVAMRAMLTRRSSVPDGTSPEADRRGYEKFYEALSIPELIPGAEDGHRGEIHVLAKLPMHSHGDKMAIVHMHLRHVEDCAAVTAREKHYDALGGEAFCRFLRTKAKREYDKHRQMCKDNQGQEVTPAAYQFLAIYEIVSIKRVAGGIRTTQPHSETSTRSRGAAADKQRASGRDDSEESEDEEWLP